jgi:hypothetical protein
MVVCIFAMVTVFVPGNNMLCCLFSFVVFLFYFFIVCCFYLTLVALWCVVASRRSGVDVCHGFRCCLASGDGVGGGYFGHVGAVACVRLCTCH